MNPKPRTNPRTKTRAGQPVLAHSCASRYRNHSLPWPRWSMAAGVQHESLGALSHPLSATGPAGALIRAAFCRKVTRAAAGSSRAAVQERRRAARGGASAHPPAPRAFHLSAAASRLTARGWSQLWWTWTEPPVGSSLGAGGWEGGVDVCARPLRSQRDRAGQRRGGGGRRGRGRGSGSGAGERFKEREKPERGAGAGASWGARASRERAARSRRRRGGGGFTGCY